LQKKWAGARARARGRRVVKLPLEGGTWLPTAANLESFLPGGQIQGIFLK